MSILGISAGFHDAAISLINSDGDTKMILTVGDSFTYGEELPNPLRAWPYLLNQPVKNMGKCGGSNDMICRVTVEETARNKFDMVIVGWSDPGRLEVWYDRQILDVNHHGRRGIPWVEDYYKYSYNKKFSYRKWFTQILSLQGYLKSIDQRYLFCNVAGATGTYDEYQNIYKYLWDKIDAKYYVGWPNFGMLDWQGDCPKAPGGHPLELGHERIAEKINEHIRNLGWLP